MTQLSARSHEIKAFTLLELAIVLVLISLVAGGALVTLTASVQQRQYNATVATMQTIDDALLRFRLANNRLPCPGDLTIAPGNAGYGMEAGAFTRGGGSCQNSPFGNVVPTATFGNVLTPSTATQPNEPISEGAVPTRTLGLPDSYMYDGWGHHIRYAVDDTMTINFTPNPNDPFSKINYSFPASSPALGSCNSVTVNDATGAARTSTSIYALISHGANGHGAYTSNGTTINANSQNADEQTNCHCGSNGVDNGTFSGTYVQKLPAQSTAGNPLTVFDDIVTYKERWQLQPSGAQDSGITAFTTARSATIYGSLVLVSGGTMYFYQQNGSVFTYRNTFTTAFPGSLANINTVAYSSDNLEVLLAGTGGGGGYSAVSYVGATNNSSMFTDTFRSLQPWNATVKAFAESNDMRLMAASYNRSPYLMLLMPLNPWFSFWGWFYPTLPVTKPSAAGPVAFSPDSKYLAVVSGTATPTFLVYGVNCATLTYLGANNPTLPAGITAVNTISFSNDSKYMALAATVSGAAEILIYKNAGGTFTAVAGSPYIPPGSNTSATGVAFSHSGNSLVAVAQGGSNTPFIYFYTNNRDDTFTAFPSPVTVGAGATTAAVAWSKDDQFVAVADGSADNGGVAGVGYNWDGLALYQVIGTTVNPLPAVATPPGASTTAVAFTN